MSKNLKYITNYIKGNAFGSYDKIDWLTRETYNNPLFPSGVKETVLRIIVAILLLYWLQVSTKVKKKLLIQQ